MLKKIIDILHFGCENKSQNILEIKLMYAVEVNTKFLNMKRQASMLWLCYNVPEFVPQSFWA